MPTDKDREAETEGEGYNKKEGDCEAVRRRFLLLLVLLSVFLCKPLLSYKIIMQRKMEGFSLKRPFIGR